MVLRIAVSFLGLAALLIGGMIFVIGPDATGQIFAAVLRVALPETPQLDGLVGADVDSEMRFYAVLWMAYGGVAMWVVRALPKRMNLLRAMLGVFWLGGLGRVLSYFAIGAPHPLFLVLMWVEIALPPVLIALSYQGGKAPTD
jgi:hypothetical protein